MASQKELATLNIRTPVENVEWLKRLAAAEDRSMNYLANQILREAREREEQAKAA